jgi:hypothetical protein
LADGDFFRLRDELEKKSGYITTSQRIYYAAIVDNAFNRNTLSIRRADTFFAMNPVGWSAQQILRLEEMLIDSYSKTGRYKDAAYISNVVLEKYKDEYKAGMANSRKIWIALSNTPPQSLELLDAFSIPVAVNDMNLLEMGVHFGNRSEEKFIFDTGANISTISASYADKLNLKQFNIGFEVSAPQGKKIVSGLAVADSLWIGKALFRNVVFIVMPDDQLNFPEHNIHLNGIIGIPVISAFKEIHIKKRKRLTVRRGETKANIQNLCWNGLSPLLQAKIGEDTVALQFDTGAETTFLYSNYYQKHSKALLTNSVRENRTIMAAGGGSVMPVVVLKKARIHFGDDVTNVNNITIHTTSMSYTGKGIAMGNIGQDVIKQFGEMVLNFDRMYVDFR